MLRSTGCQNIHKLNSMFVIFWYLPHLVWHWMRLYFHQCKWQQRIMVKECWKPSISKHMTFQRCFSVVYRQEFFNRQWATQLPLKKSFSGTVSQHLTKTVLHLHKILVEVPYENLKIFVINWNSKVDLGILYFLAAAFFWLYPLKSLVKPPLNLKGCEHIFSCFLLNPLRCNLTHVDETKRLGNYQQATFLALPVTTELTAVGTPYSALAPHVI